MSQRKKKSKDWYDNIWEHLDGCNCSKAVLGQDFPGQRFTARVASAVAGNQLIHKSQETLAPGDTLPQLWIPLSSMTTFCERHRPWRRHPVPMADCTYSRAAQINTQDASPLSVMPPRAQSSARGILFQSGRQEGSTRRTSTSMTRGT